MKHTRFRYRSAFTLIELLVVLAIITVLAGLVFTVMASSRNKANETTSLNNLKQWGSALDLSLADFDGRMPSDGMKSGSLDIDDESAWFNRLPPYIKQLPLSHPDFVKTPPKIGDRSIWVNPSVPNSLFAEINDPPNKFLFSYAMNDYLSGGTQEGPNGGAEVERTIPKIRVENPAGTIFMTEQADEKPAARPETIRAFVGPDDPKAAPKNAAYMLFCDGHVKALPRNQWDPELMEISQENPSTLDAENLNRHITFIPFKGATP